MSDLLPHLPVLNSLSNTSNVVRTISQSQLLLEIKSSSGTTFVKGTPEYDAFKLSRNCFSWNAFFNGRPAYSTFDRSTGYLFADLDNIREEDVDILRDKYWKQQYVSTIYRTLSRKGLHIIIKLHQDTIDFIEADPVNHYPAVYNYISKRYFLDELDKRASKLTQLTVLSADPELRHRSDAKPIFVPIDKLEIIKRVEISEDIGEYDKLSPIRYSDQRSPRFRSKVLHLFRSKGGQRDLLGQQLSKSNVFKLNDFFSFSMICL